MRLNLPNGKQGMVLEDLDLVPLLFGNMLGQKYHEHGKFMLVEMKSWGYSMSYPQKRLFGMMDALLRFADSHGKHYMGCYVVWWDNEENRPAAINMQPCSDAEFIQWIEGKEIWKSYDFQNDRDVGKFMTQLHNSLMGM